ncbi:MAG: hypothetical protein PHR39_07250, partial [Actinomycetota bacterium]|nr:hypothetical protein [Actinomycetota bacterium]
MAPEDKKFNDEDYFLGKKEDGYFFKKEDDYLEGKRQSRYEEDKERYSENEEYDGRYQGSGRDHTDKNPSYRKDGFDEEEKSDFRTKKYKDRFSDDFFKDEDFDYGDDEDIPSGEDPE